MTNGSRGVTPWVGACRWPSPAQPDLCVQGARNPLFYLLLRPPFLCAASSQLLTRPRKALPTVSRPFADMPFRRKSERQCKMGLGTSAQPPLTPKLNRANTVDVYPIKLQYNFEYLQICSSHHVAFQTHFPRKKVAQGQQSTHRHGRTKLFCSSELTRPCLLLELE
jgi:hypothetical protein